MTLKDFLYTCSSNTIDIHVFDSNEELLYEGMLYLIFHLDDRNIEQSEDNLAYFPFEERDEILNSKVDVWYLDNDAIGIGIVYDKPRTRINTK